MTVFQGKNTEVVFMAADPTTHAGVTGVLYTDITLATRRPFQPSLVTRTVGASDLTEIGGGFYVLALPASETTALGTVVYRITAAGIIPVYGTYQVDPQPLAFLASPLTCVVTGNIVHLGGEASEPTAVSFRAMKLPMQAPNQGLISSRLLTTFSDAVGNFSVALLRGATVSVEVPECGVKGQFVVPNLASQTLTSLVPV